MDEEGRRAKIAANEAVFRQVNERIEGLHRSMLDGDAESEMAVVCECGDLACVQQVSLDVRSYEQVRSEATLFIVVPGHDIPDVEEIVSRRDGYDVVCKNRGLGRSVAEATDPRS